jgi:sortase A
MDIDVVDSRRSSLLLDTEQSVLSLVTCYPFDAPEPGGPMRYVVTARMLF